MNRLNSMAHGAERLEREFLRWLVEPSRPLAPWLTELRRWVLSEPSPRESASLRGTLIWLSEIDPGAVFFLRPWIDLLETRSRGRWTIQVKRPSPRFKSNWRKLQTQRAFERTELPADRIYVDPPTYRVLKNGRIVRSSALARAIERLADGPPVPARELLRLAFGIPDYDPEIHQEKLFSLLSRIRRLLGPEIKIRYREGIIYSEGDRTRIHILVPSEWTHVLWDSPDWRNFLAELRPLRNARRSSVNSRILFNEISAREFFKRSELERLGSISRSSAHRLIQRWILKGLIRPQREGRIVVYRVATTQSNRRTSRG